MTKTELETIDFTIPKLGTIRGIVDKVRQIAIFRNVPFGYIPERWRAAIKPEPWTGIRDGTKQGPICPQEPPFIPMDVFFSPEGLTEEEAFEDLIQDEKNCLNSNIFVPLSSLKVGAAPVPVLAWVHGGGNTFGYNGFPLYNASNFVQHSIEFNQPIIVISITNRINLIGYLASKEFEEEVKEEPDQSNQCVGNWALLDQKLGFEWIRDNISAFGGDSNNVTAWGESAGSHNIHIHMLAPAHRGLFHRAILDSGTFDCLAPMLIHRRGQAEFDALLGLLGIPMELDGKEKLRRLRQVPAKQLSEITPKISLNPVGACNPFYDGYIIPKNMSMYSLSRIPIAYDPTLKSVMVGFNKDEGSMFARLVYGDGTLNSYKPVRDGLMPYKELIPLFEQAYGVPKIDEEYVKLVSNFMGDVMFKFGTNSMTQTLVKLAELRNGSFNVIRYLFETKVENLMKRDPGYGSTHLGELPFVFGSPAVVPTLSKEELEFSKHMQKLWIDFTYGKEITVATEGNGSIQRRVHTENEEALTFTENFKIEIQHKSVFTNEGAIFWEKFSQLSERDMFGA